MLLIEQTMQAESAPMMKDALRFHQATTSSLLPNFWPSRRGEFNQKPSPKRNHKVSTHHKPNRHHRLHHAGLFTQSSGSNHHHQNPPILLALKHQSPHPPNLNRGRSHHTALLPAVTHQGAPSNRLLCTNIHPNPPRFTLEPAKPQYRNNHQPTHHHPRGENHRRRLPGFAIPLSFTALTTSLISP